MDFKIRYMILRDLPWIDLSPSSYFVGKPIRWYRQRENTLVDIIERNNEYAKLKIYQPDGSIVIGWHIPNFVLGLYHQGDVYDGRFNHVE